MKNGNNNDTMNLIDRFVRKQREKVLSYLRTHFILNREEAEDIFQDSFLILYQNIKSGKIEDVNTTLSTSTYLLAICKNKAKEIQRSKNKFDIDSFDTEEPEQSRYIESQIDYVLSLDEENHYREEQVNQLVQDIVQDLPSPCNELLWGFYRDGFSMTHLAKEYGYASENAVKVTKHRCCEKFELRFREALKSLL